MSQYMKETVYTRLRGPSNGKQTLTHLMPSFHPPNTLIVLVVQTASTCCATFCDIRLQNSFIFGVLKTKKAIFKIVNESIYYYSLLFNLNEAHFFLNLLL